MQAMATRSCTFRCPVRLMARVDRDLKSRNRAEPVDGDWDRTRLIISILTTHYEALDASKTSKGNS